jgi:hypothetical protein
LDKLMKGLIIGNRGGTNIGGCLERGAARLALEVQLLESRQAMSAPPWLQRLNWWGRGRRPTWLGRFSRTVLAVSKSWRPDWIITTGIAPVNRSALGALRTDGVRTINYLTDDPWNPAHKAHWFLAALPHYRTVFSPRRANLEQLIRLGCSDVRYLPFAYAPELHYPEPSISVNDGTQHEIDVVFVGSGDSDRVPYLAALAQAGFRVGLYGSLWERFPVTATLSYGQAEPSLVRQVTGRAKIALCLVRRANRDGHVMRSFEIPAIGACMLAEDTNEHRALFGPEGQAVRYFSSISEMLEKTRWLLARDDERARLAQAAHTLITKGPNTYTDRLRTMLDFERTKS